jgi:hypothetical protein
MYRVVEQSTAGSADVTHFARPRHFEARAPRVPSVLDRQAAWHVVKAAVNAGAMLRLVTSFRRAVRLTDLVETKLLRDPWQNPARLLSTSSGEAVP